MWGRRRFSGRIPSGPAISRRTNEWYDGGSDSGIPTY
jgi:hypothetical protein